MTGVIILYMGGFYMPAIVFLIFTLERHVWRDNNPKYDPLRLFLCLYGILSGMATCLLC